MENFQCQRLKIADHSARSVEASCQKCCKSDVKMNKQQGSPCLENAVTKFEERRGNLVNHQHHLREKITTMERSIPALMAFNMWTSGKNCDDAPLCKIREIMNKLSPHSDPTEKLVEELKNAVKNLNRETDELHDKIIAADMKLEESEMELESVELANDEFESRLKTLEKELKTNNTPSLHSIHSDDLLCLTKIRQLGEEQVNLKNSIKELEEREAMFREQMNEILSSRDCQKAVGCNEITKKIQELDCNERRMHCAFHAQKCRQLKKKLKGKQKATTDDFETPTTSAKENAKDKTNPTKSSHETCTLTLNTDNMKQNKIEHVKKTSCMSIPRGHNDSEESLLKICKCQSRGMMVCGDKTSCPATSQALSSGKSLSLWKSLPFCNACMSSLSNQLQRHQVSNYLPKSGYNPTTSKSNVSKGQDCDFCYKTNEISKLPYQPVSCNPSFTLKPKSCKDNSTFEASSSKISSSLSSKKNRIGCDLDPSCVKCQGSTLLPCGDFLESQEKINGSRCTCKGKYSKVESDSACNCSSSMNLDDYKSCQPSGDTTKVIDQSSTDEEYFECCDCCCDDSDLSDSCQFQ